MRVEVVNVALGESGSDGVPVYLFGRDEQGEAVTVTITFNPTMKVYPANLAEKLRAYLNTKTNRVLDVQRVRGLYSIAGYCTRQLDLATLTVDNAYTYFHVRKVLMKGRRWCEQDCVSKGSALCDKCQRVVRDREGIGHQGEGVSSVYDACGDLTMQFLQQTGVPQVGWVEVPEVAAPIRPRDIRTLSEAERDGARVPCFRVASFDIECYSAKRTFPQADEMNDRVMMIATTLGWTDPARATNEGECIQFLFCIGACEPIDGVTVVECLDERDLFLQWFAFLDSERVDVLLSYNGIGFDMQYICGRLTWCEVEFDDLTFRGGCKARRTVAYKQGGQITMLDLPGITQMDMYMFVRDNYTSLSSYKLDDVANHFLGLHKVDLRVSEMFDLLERGTPADIRRVGEYCVQDTLLPLKLMHKTSAFFQLYELANITGVTLPTLINKGQSARVQQQLSRVASEMGYVVPCDRLFPDERDDGEKYEGACVLEPKVGAYLDNAVVVLDFASLYPSIIRAYNVCFCTRVTREKPGPDVEVEAIGEARFVQSRAREGIMPRLLTHLVAQRKKAKLQLAEAKKRGDEAAAKMYDMRQLAVKVCGNSVYGFTGAQGQFACKEIAASITMRGRELLMKVRDHITRQGLTVVYGDTVSVGRWATGLVRDVGVGVPLSADV